MLANDLNPISYKYLQQNVTLNKVQRNVTAFNMDGRAFIRQQCNLGEAAAAAELQQHDGMYSGNWLHICCALTSTSPSLVTFLAKQSVFKKQLHVLDSGVECVCTKLLEHDAADIDCKLAQVQILHGHYRHLVSQGLLTCQLLQQGL